MPTAGKSWSTMHVTKRETRLAIEKRRLYQLRRVACGLQSAGMGL
jgi:hypothetical protein